MEFKSQESIAFLLRQAFWGFKGVMNSKLKSLGHDFSMEQGGVLMRLGMNDGLPQNELAAFLGKDKTTIARLIDSMEKSLLVIRVASSVDKRIKLVREDLKYCFLSGNAITNSKSLSPFSFTNNGDLYFFKPSRFE